MDVLPVQGVLEKLDNIVTYSISGREALGPRKDFARVKRGLLDGEPVREMSIIKEELLIC